MPKTSPLYLIISKHRRTEKGISPEFRTDKFSVLEYLLHCLEFSRFSFSLLLHPGQAGYGLEPVFRSTASAHDIISAIPHHGDQAMLSNGTDSASLLSPQHRRLQGDSSLMGRSTHEPQCHKSHRREFLKPQAKISLCCWFLINLFILCLGGHRHAIMHM